jgi:hypothetical protein
MLRRIQTWGETRRVSGARYLGVAVLSLALAMISLGACGGDDDDAEGDVTVAELTSNLPTGDQLGLDEQGQSESDDATNLVGPPTGLVIGSETHPNELGGAIEDAGFQGSVGQDYGSSDSHVLIRAIQFDSEAGALEARDLLHDEDLKEPCPKACVVTPLEYELKDIPESAAVHHVPNGVNVPPGESRVEAHHAEFPVGSTLYVVQVSGKPSKTFTTDFDELMRTVYRKATGGE